MPSSVHDEFEKIKANLPKSGIIKISYVKVDEERAIPGRVENSWPIYDDPSDEAMQRAKQNYITKYSNQSKETLDLPAVPDLDTFKKAYADAVKVRESKEQPVKDAETEVGSATKALDTLKATEKQTEKATAKVQELEAKVADLTTKANEQQKVVDQLEQDNVKYVEKMTKLAEDLKVAKKDVEASEKILVDAKVAENKINADLKAINIKIADLENKVLVSTKELNSARANARQLRIARTQLDLNKEKLSKELENKKKLETELKNLASELEVIKNKLAVDTKDLEKIQRQYNLDNFKWAVLNDKNENKKVEFDLEKYLRDEEAKKKKLKEIDGGIRLPEPPRYPEEPRIPLPKNPIDGGIRLPEPPRYPEEPKTPLPTNPIERRNNLPEEKRVPDFRTPITSDIHNPQRLVVKTDDLNTLPNTGIDNSSAATIVGVAAFAVAARLRKEMKE